ncbi:ROK family protein [Hyalangium versicolor]|uniref:ROK family protein n=1 Tax=Hyalangium versicolor TaxID=2861190 RepID=UPI001CCB8F1E|nr:ROK family protein [Hyalangium versicolor]
METFGGIEAGGTWFVCVVGDSERSILAEARFPTTTPEETLGRVVAFFREQNRVLPRPISALGVACFGPLELAPGSPRFGCITTTPKPGWAHTPIVRTLQEALDVPVTLDTDVNAAAIAEGTWGAAAGLDNFIYLTIGTGIGGGGVFNGQPLHGLVHPEMGHIRVPHDWQRDPYPGACPYHGDCFEGLAAGPALRGRWGIAGESLPSDHPAWALEAHYIAQGLHGLICTLSPTRLILGGGVMQQAQLFPLIRAETVRLLNGYVSSPSILEGIDQYIVPPGLGHRSGVMGALALARRRS